MEAIYSSLLQLIVENSHDYSIMIYGILAQTIEDPDVLGQMQDAWSHFLASGQAWALGIGVFLGYSFKGFTG